MNYNVFAQDQGLQMQQIPFDRPIYNKISQVPNPNCFQFSQNLQPFAINILDVAVRKIQDGQTASEPRMYFFNMMAANGFENPQFRDFLIGFQRTIEVICIAQNQPVNAILPQIAEDFVQYSVAMAALNNNFILQRQNPQVIAAMQGIVNTFSTVMATMQNAIQQPQQTSMYGQNMQMGQMNRQQPQAPSFAVGQSGLFTGGPQPSVGVNLSMPAISSPTAGMMGVNAPMVNPAALSNVFAQPSNQVAPQVAAPPMLTTQPVQVLQAAAPATASNLINPSTGEPTVVAVKDINSLAWTASARWKVIPTYDPNREELKFHVYSDGSIQPVIAQKANMDRNAHLSPLNITPVWAVLAQKKVNESYIDDTSPKDVNVARNVEDVREVAYPENVSTTTNHKDNMLLAEASLLSQRKNFPNSVLMINKYTVLVDTVFCSGRVARLFDELLSCSSLSAAATLLSAATEDASRTQNHLDQRAIRRMINRLTQRVNRFVSVDMSLNFGRTDSLLEDAAAMPAFFENKLGKSAKDVFEESHRRLIVESLSYAKGELLNVVQANQFSKSPLAEDSGLHMFHMCNNMAYGAVDVSSIELRAQIPNAEYSALISESSTPFLYNLARKLTNPKTAQAKGGPAFRCDRHLLSTNDGVVLEIAPAAFNHRELVVGLYNGN